LRGGVVPGGAVLRELPSVDVLRSVAADAAEIAAIALGHTVVADRFTGTAILSAEAARDLGTLGYVARASGLPVDARRDHPFTDLGDFSVATRTTGDVLARFQVRADEIATSVEIILRLLDGMAPGPETVEIPA